MDFNRHKNPLNPTQSETSPALLIGMVLKVVVFIAMLSVGLWLTFWAVGVIDELLHRPQSIPLLQPLLAVDGGAERTLTIEHTDDSFTLRDHNALSLILLVGLLLVLFGAVGRSIAALISGSVRVLLSIFVKPPTDKTEPPRLP